MGDLRPVGMFRQSAVTKGAGLTRRTVVDRCPCVRDDAAVGEVTAVRRLAAVALLGLIALVGCSTSKTSSLPTAHVQLPCPAKPTGTLCIRVFAHHLELDDAVGYLVSSEPSLENKTWRLVLTSYDCDPGHGVRSRCAPSGVFPGPIRHGLPPAATSCRSAATGAITTTPAGCHDTLTQAMATHGDWAGLDQLAQGKPMTFAHPVWLCVSEQVFKDTWKQPDTEASPTPTRACSALRAA